MLWHFTAKYAPQGDIGRFSDRRIEAALDWTCDRWRKPGQLIQALIAARWIDIDTPSGAYQPSIDSASTGDQHGISGVSATYHRLIIHDWADHADESTRKRLARAGLQFVMVARKVTGQNPDTDWKVSATMAENGSLPEPEPLPEPLPHTAGARAPVTERSAKQALR